LTKVLKKIYNLFMPKNATTKKPPFEVKIKIPQSVNWRKFLPKSSSQILVILLVIAAFLIGVLFDKVQYLEKNQAGNQVAAAPLQPPAGQPAQIAPGTKVNVANGRFPAKGNKNAKVTIVEFADFRCPFCEQFYTNTEPQIIKDYVDTGKVQFYFRQYAFLGPASVVAADAAECANDQGKFWDFHDYLYKNQPAETDTTMYNTDTLTQAAVSLGMDGNTFKSCLDNKTDDAKASQDMADGQKAGVSGTPTFFINGVSLVGAQPYSAFHTAINQALAKAK
jgi:protein-disulfide isomerase